MICSQKYTQMVFSSFIGLTEKLQVRFKSQWHGSSTTFPLVGSSFMFAKPIYKRYNSWSVYIKYSIIGLNQTTSTCLWKLPPHTTSSFPDPYFCGSMASVVAEARREDVVVMTSASCQGDWFASTKMNRNQIYQMTGDKLDFSTQMMVPII